MLKKGTPVYVSTYGKVIESYVTVFPGTNRDYYRVWKHEYRLPSNLNEWPEDVSLHRENAEKHASRWCEELDAFIAEWEEKELSTPTALLQKLYNTYTFGYPNHPYWKLKHDILANKIHEYFGVDVTSSN